MVDKFNPAKRSEIMSRIGAKNTKPELAVRKILHGMGFRFRLHCKDLPGKPDIVLRRFKTAIFVHGCFWHGHAKCRRAALPAVRREFWQAKIAANRARDRKTTRSLGELGYHQLTVWQCELKDQERLIKRFYKIRLTISARRDYVR